MSSWTFAFLIIALLAGLLGFAGIAGTAAVIAKALFVIFSLLFAVSLFRSRKKPPEDSGRPAHRHPAK